MATCFFSHNIKPIKLLSQSQRQREAEQLTHNINTGDLDVLQFYCNNAAYGAIPPLFSLLRLSIEKHVKSDLFIVLPTTDSSQSVSSTAEGFNTDENE